MGKYNQGMQMLARVLIASAPAMYIMMFFVLMGMILFGSLVFFFEEGEWRDGEGACPRAGKVGGDPAQYCWMRPDVLQDAWEPSPFAPYGIPGAFWWVLATATTVGYGDFYPTSAGGKLIGSACMVAGVLVMALPISIVGANFNKEYMSMMEHEQEELMEEARRQERAAIARIERLYDLRTVALTDGAAAGAGPAGVAPLGGGGLDALADIDE